MLSLTGRLEAEGPPVAPLPTGIVAEWDLAKAASESTTTRERLCLNGLWCWQPAGPETTQVPSEGWGHFKVPGPWPGITDYMQKDCQTVFPHPAWATLGLAGIRGAWYQRTLRVPVPWTGRRIVLRADYVNSYATVYLDGDRIGEIRFPGGELDLTAACRPGRLQTLSLLVEAMPLKAVLLSYTDSASAREVKGSVQRRGLCGDVFLLSTPSGPRIEDVRAEPSIRQKQLVIRAGLAGVLQSDSAYELVGRVLDRTGTVLSTARRLLTAADLEQDHVVLRDPWIPNQLWDVDSPQNMLRLEVSLLDRDENLLDAAWPERFGFREFWIDGRDFILNGTRIALSAVPLDNAEVSAATATYAAARESLERLQSFGINYVYTHNYGCEPGSHLGFEEILRAADDVGMLVGLSMPHFSAYDWPNADADRTNGYARHAEFYVGAAGDHPSVVFYPMSHNATGYSEDMNPDMIDGIHDDRDTWAARNATRALRAETIVERLDPTRIVYHHAGGNIGAMHTSNFYPNFAPIQELSDWFQHWSIQGVKPVFLCEYGAPFTWDWTLYRGWYRGEREFGSAQVPWEFCLPEWNAQFLGDTAFALSEPYKADLRWEARQFRDGRTWHRWDYPYPVGSRRFDERYPVFARYLTDNWRAFRTWGVSGTSPWEHEHFWTLRDGVDRSRQALPVDWEHLQRPGFSPDYLDQRYERMDMAFERSDWVPTPAAEAILRNNRPLLAYIGGPPAAFTAKDHIFVPGESFEKQLIVLNNSRHSATCDCRWSVNLPVPVTGEATVHVPAGGQSQVPFRVSLPQSLTAGAYTVSASFRFDTGETQEDPFAIDVLSGALSLSHNSRAGDRVGLDLFDPVGDSVALLTRLGISFRRITANSPVATSHILVIGRKALSVDGPAPDLLGVRDGLRVIVFEQTREVLEQRLGFRAETYGLRRVFPRMIDHPALAGLKTEHLRDWRGEATLVPQRLSYEMRPRYGPTIRWCDIPVTRVWRCGNRGNVASVLIEKPARGDFLPIVDGGFSLQFSPLLEYREGRGLIVFCQLDVSGRTESEPAANLLVRNLVHYVDRWKPSPRRQAVYVGDPEGVKYLEHAGISLKPGKDSRGSAADPDDVWVVGPGRDPLASGSASEIRKHLEAGGRLFAIGVDGTNASAFLPVPLKTRRAEHIATEFGPVSRHSPWAGIGPADLMNRDPREFPLVTSGAQVLGDGMLAAADDGQVVFCQLAPWTFTPRGQGNLRRTYRRASFVVARVLANLGVAAGTPLLDRFSTPVASDGSDRRWLTGLYMDTPEEWDDPYRFFRW